MDLLKPSIHFVDIMKCACEVLVKIKLFLQNYDFLNLVILGSFLHYRVWSLCNQPLPQFSVNLI